ncbi:hypothetical protein HMPREF9072_00301 [Capnocytophaga sp. oral taxon 324 str. F0483]|nr:hypothetical protein HMPREF9072_00301 [Capnocytophaga sp. oral taxon 324 str. F0483]
MCLFYYYLHRSYTESSVVLQWFFSGSTVALQWLYRGSTVALQWLYPEH